MRPVLTLGLSRVMIAANVTSEGVGLGFSVLLYPMRRYDPTLGVISQDQCICKSFLLSHIWLQKP